MGYLYLGAGAFRDPDDDRYTKEDASGDCISDTTQYTNPLAPLVPDYLSDVLLANGKYGCSVGNKTQVSLGRFIPHHFAVTPGSVGPGCGAFTYFGQDGFTTTFTLTAQNAGNNITTNYAGVWAKLVPTSWPSYGFTAAPLPAGSSLDASATAPTGAWSSGSAEVVAKHQITRPANPAAPTTATVSALPVDRMA